MIIFSRVGWHILIVKFIINLIFLYSIYHLYKISASFSQYLEVVFIWIASNIIIGIIYKINVKFYIKRLLMKLGTGFWEYKVKIIKDPSINAFAYKRLGFFSDKEKKYIGVTTGLLKKCSKDEINFAIAHELSHHRNNDIVVSFFTKVFGKLFKSGLGLIKTFKSGSVLGFLASLAIEVGIKFLLKKQELRADKDAFHYLKEAGLNPSGGLKFFERLKNNPDNLENTIFGKLLLTITDEHPFLETRIKKQRELLETHINSNK